MKKFLKCFSVYMAVALVLLSAVLYPSVNVSAAEPVGSSTFLTLDSPFVVVKEGFPYPRAYADYISPIYLSASDNVSLDVDLDGAGISYSYNSDLPSGRYTVYGSLDGVSTAEGVAFQVAVFGVFFSGNNSVNRFLSFYDFGEEFVIPDDPLWEDPFTSGSEHFTYVIVAQSLNILPVISRADQSEDPLYYSAFQMFADFIYGEGVVLTAEQNMVLTILATIAALAVVVVPFVVVWLIIRFLTGG